MDTATPAPPSLSVSQLAASFGSPHAPLVLDVRRDSAFAASRLVIPGALRAAPQTVGSDSLPWLRHLPQGRPIVVYCVHGHEVSQGVARALLEAGYYAAYLVGGMAAWEAGALPTLRKQSELGIPATLGTPSRWITRERPKIDRIACPWLIRRFIDPSAQFLYVPSDQVVTAADRERAIAYDIPRVRFSHRGEQCSFDAFLVDFELRSPVLDALATIVRGADTDRVDLAPQAAGLVAVSLGLSVMYGDDHAMLERAVEVYDALYAWLRAARGEVHNAELFKTA